MNRIPIQPEREWVTFPDPGEDDRRWRFDVTFLTSRWNCIYGRGCQGVRTRRAPELAEGCCSFGAHFAEDDLERVKQAARELRDDEWQFARIGRKRGIVASHGASIRTRLVDDACIFLNRPGFARGAGCALHVLAERLGGHEADTKPDVCWQLPLRRVDEEEDDGTVTSVVTKFTRDSWGEGGEEFAWWCTEASEAFTARRRVYQSLEPELRRMCGDALYEGLAAYLDALPRRRHGPRDPASRNGAARNGGKPLD